MRFFCSDLHLGGNEVLERENRPFDDWLSYAYYQIKVINNVADIGDEIYVLGDFLNCNDKEIENTLYFIKYIHADVILIIGNNEERVIDRRFNGSFDDFRDYCLRLGFKEVYKELYLKMYGRTFYLQHYINAVKKDYINLFGHIHRAYGWYHKYGINVSLDLNHFQLWSEFDILRFLYAKWQWFDKW